MRTDAVIAIAGAHDARNAASRPTVPVPDRSCRARILVRGSDEKTSDEKMKASDVEAAGRPADPDPAWCCRWSSRHRAPARTPQGVQLVCTRRCPPLRQRDGARPSPLPAKGRHYARTSRTPPGSEPCHHPAAPIPQRHRPAEAFGPADALGGHQGAHARTAARGRRVPRGDVTAAQDDAPSPPPCIVSARVRVAPDVFALPGQEFGVIPNGLDQKDHPAGTTSGQAKSGASWAPSPGDEPPRGSLCPTTRRRPQGGGLP